MWLLEHTRPRQNRQGFQLPRVEFDQLLINWDYYSPQADPQHILCEFEYLVPHFATWVSRNGYQGEGGQLAAHLRSRTATLASVIEGSNEPEDRTYQTLWEEAENEAREDQPLRPRVRAASKAAEAGASGAASSPPSGRTSSLGSWVGSDFIPS